MSSYRRRTSAAGLTAAALAVGSLAAAPAATAATAAPAATAATAATADPAARTPQIVTVGQIAVQDVAPQPGSEPRTLVEPDIGVSPVDPGVAVAVAHDGRFPDGGAVGITHAWTRDGGVHWQHAPMPGLTVATGGEFSRASDPVVAYGPGGAAYVSTLLIDIGGACHSAVAVSRSTDGGRTFGRPVLVHESRSCRYSDDKNWIVVDSYRSSPHFGRIYQFWTPFLFSASGKYLGSPQAVRFSDDQGRHWSSTSYVTGSRSSTQNSQPMVRPDGSLVDRYLSYPPGEVGDRPERPLAPGQALRAGKGTVRIQARSSADGGRTWSDAVTVGTNYGGGPRGIRCCLPSATADPDTHRLYVGWEAARPDGSRAVVLSSSTDGRHWSAPATVNGSPADHALQYVNVDVAAGGGTVFVSYARRDPRVAGGRYLQQQLVSSADGGRNFRAPLSLGPLSDLRYAAQAGGVFPGDYIGSAISGHRLYTVWARSTRPPGGAEFNQSLFAAAVRF